MSITDSKNKITNALTAQSITVGEIHTAEIVEAGCFIVYNGCKRIGIGEVIRKFIVVVATFDNLSSAEIKVSECEQAFYEASLSNSDISHTGTQPLSLGTEGLFLYQLQVEFRDIE